MNPRSILSNFWGSLQNWHTLFSHFFVTLCFASTNLLRLGKKTIEFVLFYSRLFVTLHAQKR